MTAEEIEKLCQQYADTDGYRNPTDFECRYDAISSRQCYSLIRHFRPKNVLAIGTWYGGSTCMIMSALLKGNYTFRYIASEILPGLQTATTANSLRICGRSPEMIGDITESLSLLPTKIDFLFIDTNHDEDVTHWIFQNVFPRLKSGALVAIHDWAVREIDGNWVGKGAEGIGGLPETQYLMDLHKKGKLPLEKLYWNYTGGITEASFWIYKPL